MVERYNLSAEFGDPGVIGSPNETETWGTNGPQVEPGPKYYSPSNQWRLLAVDDLDTNSPGCESVWKNVHNGLAVVRRNPDTLRAPSSDMPGEASPMPEVMVGTGQLLLSDRNAELLVQEPISQQLWILSSNFRRTLLPIMLMPSERPVGVADFNGDGIDDLVVQQIHNGQYQIWKLSVDGSTTSSVPTLAEIYAIVPAKPVDPGWNLASVGEFDGSGSPDLLWINQGTGKAAVWLMEWTPQGLVRKAGGITSIDLGAAPTSKDIHTRRWRIAAPN
ncbi:MAG: VCBS repeat-containing protein [Rhodanobacteraceae bacterium]|nr:VCBS repeat-containing protein [Rhodanobacteraceae bacterium]